MGKGHTLCDIHSQDTIGKSYRSRNIYVHVLWTKCNRVDRLTKDYTAHINALYANSCFLSRSGNIAIGQLNCW